MSALQAELSELATGIAWSQWAELGVESRPAEQESQVIDLEPLIIFSAGLGLHDKRLGSSSLDWCIANVRLISTIRLGRLLGEAGETAREAFEAFAATVHAHTGVQWPGAGRPAVRLPTAREMKPDLRRPALLQLRLRALVGISARAEVLRVLLSNPERPRSTSMLADVAAYSKGSVAQALEMLASSGIVQVQPAANRLVYRLSRPRDLMQLLQWTPGSVPDWWSIFRLIEALESYARRGRTGGRPMAAAEALLSRIRRDLRRLDITTQEVPRLGRDESIPAFETWVLTRIGHYANPTNVALRRREVSYTIHRLGYGGWTGTINERGREPQPLGLIEDAGGRDLGGLEPARSMLRDALVNAAPGEWPSEAIIEAVSREFADDLFRPMRPGQDATFSAEFVRRWLQSRGRTPSPLAGRGRSRAYGRGDPSGPSVGGGAAS